MQEVKINNKEEISLKEIIEKSYQWWRFILTKWLIIFCAGVVGGGLGLAYALIKKPIYIAELTFALQDDKSSSGGLGGALGLASQFGFDVGGSAGGEFTGDNLLELMKSRSMITKTFLTPVSINNKKTTLADYYIEVNELRKGWKGKQGMENLNFLPGADPSKFTLKQDSVLGKFHDDIIKTNLAVDKIDKKLSIINVKVNSTNELFSKYFAETLTTVVSDFYVQTKTGKSAKNVAILQRQTDSVRRMLNGAISGVAASVDINPNPNPYLATLRVPSQHKQVDVQANTAILTQLVTNLEIAKMSLLQETPLIQIIDHPILPLPKDRVGKLASLIQGGLIGLFVIVVIISVKELVKRILLT